MDNIKMRRYIYGRAKLFTWSEKKEFIMQKNSIEPTLSFQSNDAYNTPVGMPEMQKVEIEPTLSFQSNDAYNSPVGTPLK
jgi:hypothetical protein